MGFLLTAASVAGLLGQIPAGELLDIIRAKRRAFLLSAAIMAGAAAVIALWPSFLFVVPT